MDTSTFIIPTYNKIAQTYTDQYYDDPLDRPYIDKLLDALSPESKILDIGCGPGTFTQYLKTKHFNVEGIDLSEEMIKIARTKLPDIHFQLMDMKNLEFPNESFDALLVGYSLIHIPSEEIPKTLEGFHRVLKKDGKIMIIAQGGESDQVVDEPLKEGEKIFINFFTKERLKKYLEESGFSITYQEELPLNDPDSLSDRVIYTIATSNR